jgi:hypothetical protein
MKILDQANELIALSTEAHEAHVAARLKKDPPPILHFNAGVISETAAMTEDIP